MRGSKLDLVRDPQPFVVCSGKMIPEVVPTLSRLS
jgi:hypothetical protein